MLRIIKPRSHSASRQLASESAQPKNASTRLAGPWGLLALLVLILLPAAHAEKNFRLGENVRPTFQQIILELDAEQENYRGSVKIELQVDEPTSLFHFHSEGPTIEALRLSREGEAIAASHEPIGDDVVAVATEQELAPGPYRLEIDFENAFDTQAISLYRAAVDGAYYTFTQFEADDAREAFPCWDEPAFKIPYQMILSVPEAHLAITNTPAASSRVEKGWRTTTFERTPPLPSYLLAISTGPLETVEVPGLGMPARIVTVKGRSHLTSLAVEVMPPILKALEAYFDRPYPYRKLDSIAVPEFWPGAMENPGAITYAERLLVIDPATVTVGQRRSQARVIAHELAHQWFGNLVTMEWWDDLWLNESFADWMADKITHQLFPELAADISGIRSGHRIMIGDAMETAVAVRQPVESTANLLQDVGLAYAKGKMVLGMFEQWIGEDAFRRGVLDYIEAREWGNATAEDLFAALSKASDAPIAAAMATFIDQPGVPRIELEPLEGGAYRLAQERYRMDGAETPDQTWKVPVVLRYAVDGEIKSRTVLLSEPSITVELAEKVDWLHPNAGGRGYYRWSLPPEMLRQLAAAGAALEPVERINLIGNSAALLQADEMDGGAFLGVLAETSGDPDAAVVSAALSELGLVEAAFVPEKLEPAYGAWLRETLTPALDLFGAAQRQGEAETVTLLRPQLLSLLAEHGHEAVKENLRAMAKAFFENPSSVDPTLVPLALRMLAEDGDVELYEEFKKRANEATTPRMRGLFLGTLSAFEKPELQQRTLAFALSDGVRPNELFNVVGGFFEDAAGRDLVFGYMLENWEKLIARLPPPFRAFMPRLAEGCSAERLARATDFFTRPENTAPGMERSLARVTESVTSCVDLRKRESASVAAYLEPYK